MNDELDFFTKVARDFRYGITLVATFILGLFLLFYEDLVPAIQDTFVPSLAIYVLGTGVITGVQTLVTASANTKARADGKEPRGIPERWLKAIIALHLFWFVLLIAYNVVRAIL
jgi:hypothetical protein